MIEILRDEGNFIALKMSGNLHDADYKEFEPVITAATLKGKLHLLVEMTDFEGWDHQALWHDIQLDKKISDEIGKPAFIGDKKREVWMAKICKPFTRAEIQYFDSDEAQDAWAWVQDGLCVAQLFYPVIQLRLCKPIVRNAE